MTQVALGILLGENLRIFGIGSEAEPPLDISPHLLVAVVFGRLAGWSLKCKVWQMKAFWLHNLRNPQGSKVNGAECRKLTKCEHGQAKWMEAQSTND